MQELMETRFAGVDQRFASMQELMETRFAAVDQRFASMQELMETRFAAVDQRFEAVDRALRVGAGDHEDGVRGHGQAVFDGEVDGLGCVRHLGILISVVGLVGGV